MMKKTWRACVSSVFLLKFFLFYSQPNLVPNPSFENTVKSSSNCGYPSNLPDCKDWYITYSPKINTPDYYTPYNFNSLSLCGSPQNQCGYQLAKSGTSYVGIVGYLYSYLYYLNSREYFSVKLKDSLKKDVYYCGSFNVCLAEMSRAVIKELGMCLTKEPITNTCSPLAPADTIMFQIFFKLKPQVQSQIIISDSIHWTEIKNAFKAEGGERNT